MAAITTTPSTRTCKFVRTAAGTVGVLTLTVCGLAADYYLEEIADSTGGRVFRLERFKSQRRTEEGETYYVRLGGCGSCDCPAGIFKRSKPCKHRDAVRALVAAGRI